MDTQGLASGNQEGLNRLFTFSVLLSNVLVLNVLMKRAQVPELDHDLPVPVSSGIRKIFAAKLLVDVHKSSHFFV